MKEYYELTDDGGVISSPYDSVESVELDFEELCKGGFSFNDNIKIVKVVKHLK